MYMDLKTVRKTFDSTGKARRALLKENVVPDEDRSSQRAPFAL
jgi:hypothetical protein